MFNLNAICSRVLNMSFGQIDIAINYLCIINLITIYLACVMEVSFEFFYLLDHETKACPIDW